METIDQLILIIKRDTIQAGIPNTRYPIENLYDSRLTHHIPTDAVQQWKQYGPISRDSKYSDLKCIADPSFLAEGKVIGAKNSVCLAPSVSVGGGRHFNPAKLDLCLKANSFYFLYETVGHTDITLTFHIYWVPIHLILEWYKGYGNSGKIHTIRKILSKYSLHTTIEDRSK